MHPANHALARIFSDMSALYRYLGPAERFREIAYAKAARTLDNMKEDIRLYCREHNPDDIPGVGESMAEKILEFIRGGKVGLYEDLKKKVPFELLDLMHINGLGPATLKTIHENLGIETKEAFIHALESGAMEKIKGFGKARIEAIRRGMKLHKSGESRLPLHTALELSDKILSELKTIRQISRIEVAGSLRRRKETIGDIDILMATSPKERSRVMELFLAMPFVKKILAKGETKASITEADFDKQVDLRIVNEEEWGAALLYFTGSKEHNIRLRTLARDRGWKINEYGVFDLKTAERIAGKTEEEIYRLFDFSFIPPELREDRGELNLAADHKIPDLIEKSDIRGDLHLHSDSSDGNSGILQLAQFAMKNYPYDYIVITDHSKSERIAGGMDEAEFLKQIQEIDALNLQLGKDFIKKGAEVDILQDGSLDLDDQLLSKLDWVCASIHSGFGKDNTERLLKACHHPLVHCIGHPTGRLIGKREAYRADWKKVFETAARTGTALEINAQPDRMDLNDEMARQAIEAGVKLVISTDSHLPENLEFMKEGVFIARRAGCTSGDILNTGYWKRLEKFTAEKKSKAEKKESFISSLFKYEYITEPF
jgi:DNA polymerase (family 10)